MEKILIFLLLLSVDCFAAEVTKKVALVIGNAAYPTANLKNPVNDANAIASKLRELGFEVLLKTDANQKDMSRVINEFGERIKLGSTALFYYAGHGIQVRGKNFLIPVDADIASEAAVRGESIDVEQVLDQITIPRQSRGYSGLRPPQRGLIAIQRQKPTQTNHERL